jgi:LuxR family maltose regulon positive regulatory protein
LSDGLEAGRRITLVSAPAGFGKTTCVAAWLETLDCPLAWLSLEPADDDPGRFFAYLLAAVQQVDADLGRAIEGLLRAGQLPPGEAISTSLINDIQRLPARFLLVLDDFHLIQDRLILQVLEALIANQPPALHLVLLTREDPPLPLARSRANNQLTEVRAADLRFSRPEAAHFLNEVMGLSLSPADVAALETKTEGWIAGLQLAALALQPLLAGREEADPSAFIGALSGSHRFILGYLTEQVLNRQPAAVRRFLLQTAILDQLNGDLCDAVTGRSDGRAALERLFQANLFLIPLDDEGQWYRYHHLFADLLRELQNRLRPDDTAELHRRASRWYAGADRPGEAIEHALAAQDYAAAVDLLERHAMGLIMQGYAQTVDGWLQAIPAEWALSSPRTDLAFAWMHLLRGAYAQVAPYLDRAQAAFAGSEAAAHPGEEKSALRAEWLAMQALMSIMEGRPSEAKAMASRALDMAPGQDDRLRSLAYYALAGVCQSTADYDGAVEAYQRAMQHARAADNLFAEMMSTAGLAVMAFEYGQLHLTVEIIAPAIARLERWGGLPPASAVVYGMLGEVYCQWLQLKEARHHNQRALQLSTLGGYNTAVIFCRLLLSRLCQLEGDLEAASQEIQQAVELLPAKVPDYVRQEVAAQQVRLYLARNRPAAAEMVLQGQGVSSLGLPPGREINHSSGLLYNSYLHLLLHQARAGRDPAGLPPGIELAGRLIAAARQGRYLLVAVEALLLRAQIYAELGDGQSRADTIRALELAEPGGFLAVFVEQGLPVARALADLVKDGQPATVQPGYVRRILDAFPPAPPSHEPVALVEPLTDRELEVLRLMAEGLKYKEIAERLVISLNTVRFHVKAIYGKLGVNNRIRAVEAARQHRIL